MPRRLDSLTGLRGLAAFIVFFHHSAEIHATRHVFAQGRVGVSFFFILSGFVLMWAHDDDLTPRRFYQRRFARIYPAYIVSWIGALILIHALDLGTVSHEVALQGAALLQSWSTTQDHYFGGNYVAWSLSCEAFFYLTFPFWASKVTRLARRSLLALGIAAITGTILVAAVAQWRHPSSGFVLYNPGDPWTWLVRIAPPVRLLEFLLGATVAVAVRRGWLVDIGLGRALLLALAAYALAGVPTQFSSSAITLVPFVLVIVAATAADVRGAGSLFSKGWARWAGEISYSFYLVHQLVIRAAEKEVPHLPGRVAIELALAVPAAAALHYLVERPAERRLSGRNSVVVGEPAAATS